MLPFAKYQALGNDYIVLEADDLDGRLDPPSVRRICHRHYGVGADGILLLARPEGGRPPRVRIFNPDGSEAEKSGNGLRILARYLWDRGSVESAAFPVDTRGGRVSCRVGTGARDIEVAMGRASFDSRDIPVTGPPREVLEEAITAGGETFTYAAVTLGNPHCVVLRERAAAEDARRFGPLIERDARFPNRTNVQFVEILDRRRIRIEIWERGAGYTLASGSSSCAAAAAAHRLGRCDATLTVCMPGGELRVDIGERFDLRLSGPVVKVAHGHIAREALEAPAR